MTPLYIFDLDGTLADLKHRRHFVELHDGAPVKVQNRPGICRGPNPKIAGDFFVEFPDSITGLWSYDPRDIKFKPNWDAFHAACVNDTPIRPVIATVRLLAAAGAEILIWSGRSDSVESQTRKWLYASTGILWGGALTMRKHGDFTPDDQLKESWLLALSPEDRARLVMVFDDRDRVVNMWRRHGVVCAQVAPGDF